MKLLSGARPEKIFLARSTNQLLHDVLRGAGGAPRPWRGPGDMWSHVGCFFTGACLAQQHRSARGAPLAGFEGSAAGCGHSPAEAILEGACGLLAFMRAQRTRHPSSRPWPPRRASSPCALPPAPMRECAPLGPQQACMPTRCTNGLPVGLAHLPPSASFTPLAGASGTLAQRPSAGRACWMPTSGHTCLDG